MQKKWADRRSSERRLRKIFGWRIPFSEYWRSDAHQVVFQLKAKTKLLVNLMETIPLFYQPTGESTTGATKSIQWDETGEDERDSSESGK